MEVSKALTFNFIHALLSNIFIEFWQILSIPKMSPALLFSNVWLNGLRAIVSSGLLLSINFKNKQEIMYPSLALIKGSISGYYLLTFKNYAFLLMICWKSLILSIFRFASSSKRSQPNCSIYITIWMSEISKLLTPFLANSTLQSLICLNPLLKISLS